ncbi:hypothetical protein [Streptomyces antnestii]|uniref:hypothetical protein n=1 Tax=Streptomyces antnestii TaxID=2494256 RepID=UPI00167544CB|nr:hypothetical protein [Streptomyces sp. San01]
MAAAQQVAVGPGELRLVDLPLQNGQLVAQRQDFGVLVAVAHQQDPYQGEHTRHRSVHAPSLHIAGRQFDQKPGRVSGDSLATSGPSSYPLISAPGSCHQPLT